MPGIGACFMKTLFTAAEIAGAVKGTVHGDAGAAVYGVSTDSRTIKPGELFVPLKGERFDGHAFIADVLARGIKVFITSDSQAAEAAVRGEATCITVPDTLRALGNLAAGHRSRFSVPITAITGSNGKTTTREMLASILGRTGEGLKTSGNLNNLIGLPQMLFQLSEHHRWAVLEMGMSEPGEIDRLAEIARPDVGVITNVSPAHLQSMGTVGAVASAKGELFQRLASGKHAVYNADDPLVAALPSPSGVSRLSFGCGPADVRAGDYRELGRDGQSFLLVLPSGKVPVRLKAFGRHNTLNALAAAAAAYALGIALQDIRDGLEAFVPFEKRFAPEDLGGILLVDDSYNANPASMKAALLTLGQLAGQGRAIAVLGDMLELGGASASAHEEVGRLAGQKVARLYLAGERAGNVAEGALAEGLAQSAIIVANSHEEILEDLLGIVREGDCILVKGSRGMRMDVVAEGLRNSLRPAKLKGAGA